MVDLHARNMRANAANFLWSVPTEAISLYQNYDYKIMYYARQLKSNSGNP